MLRKNVFYAVIITFFFASCQRNYLSIQHRWIDRDYLASTYVDTPDPAQKCPPCGKNILIEWNFPISVFREGPTIFFTAMLWDNTICEYKYKVSTKKGNTTLFFPEKPHKKRLLTYKIEVCNKQNQMIECMEHQFWTKTIQVSSDI